ncbi:MAG: type II secretion system protein J [bacterium]
MNSRQERVFPKNRCSSSGFTLLELIIALMLSSVIILIIVSVLQLAIRSEEKGTKRQDESQHVRVLVSRIAFFLKGAYPYMITTKEEKNQQYYFDGGSDSLSFITSSVTPREDSLIDKPGMKWVRIFTDSEGLKVSENFFFLDDAFEEDADERLIDDTVTELAFEYLDTGEDGTSQPEWTSSWSTDDKPYLPAAIRVAVTIEEDEKEVELPPFTVKVQITKRNV